MSEARNMNEMFSEAHDEGDLSAKSLQALSVDADIGNQIQAGLGVGVDDVPASEVVLVTMMPDDSGSIRYAGQEDAVIEGHNIVLEALEDSKQRENVLVHNRYLNGKVLYPYRKLEDAEKMTSGNYQAVHGTPLYDQAAVILGTVLAKAREFEDAGVPARTITLILSDGEDMHSAKQTADSVRAIVEDLLAKETHIIAAMGIGEKDYLFHQIFTDMGIRPEWILTPGDSPTEIRKAFQVFSRSAVRASQSGAVFSATSAGGFLS